uniref:RRM domain-containing protein n=1 Tax=Meloidogyne javanica TaxID=6303 RepID=A0A915MVT4_MELJA
MVRLSKPMQNKVSGRPKKEENKIAYPSQNKNFNKNFKRNGKQSILDDLSEQDMDSDDSFGDSDEFDEGEFIKLTGIKNEDQLSEGDEMESDNPSEEDEENETKKTSRRENVKMRRASIKASESRTVFVGNAPVKTQQRELRKLSFGEIEAVYQRTHLQMTEKLTKMMVSKYPEIEERLTSTNFYIRFVKDEQAENAARAMNGTKLNGHVLRVTVGAKKEVDHRSFMVLKRGRFEGNGNFNRNQNKNRFKEENKSNNKVIKEENVENEKKFNKNKFVDNKIKKVRLGDLVRVRNPEDGVSVPNTDEDYYYISSYSGEEDDHQEVTTAIEYKQSWTSPRMKQAVSNVRKVSAVRQTKSCGDLPNLVNVEDGNPYGEYEDEENGTTNNNYSSSYSNDADVSSSCDEEEDGSFYSTRSWGSYDQSCSESVSYSSYSEESNVSFSTSSASTAFSLVGKTVRVVSFKQSNMRLNPENIQESNVTEVPRSSQHKDESSSQDEYFMATNELSSNSSEMYYSDAVSEEKVVPRLMPEYNLYSTQQEFRNCAVEACNMNTFLQLIECSFPQEWFEK